MKSRITDSETLHTALIFCRNHLDPTSEAVVVNKNKLQRAIDRHVQEVVLENIEAESRKFLDAITASLSSWLGLQLKFELVNGSNYKISAEGPQIPRPKIPNMPLEIGPPEIVNPKLDARKIILGMN